MGGALRAIGLAATLVAVGLVVAPPPSAEAVTTSRPTAVAVASDGTSYVGFASGGWLARLDAAGAPLGQVPLDRAGPVGALAVDPDDHVWVDYGDQVSELAGDGTLLTTFAHGSGCADDRAHDPQRYGGLVVTSDTVYVASRCTAVVEIHTPEGGLRATLDLPGTALPRGISWQRAQAGEPARLYVAVPDTAKVHVYAADGLTSASTPIRTLVVARPDGFRVPVPAGVAADAFGQLVVSDVANHALYFYDANNDFAPYRTLGHPPDPSGNLGYLDRPTALAQHAQDGGDLAGRLWIADTGNGRVQHWTTEGTSLWMADVTAPGPVGAPVNTGLPEVSGAPFDGESLTCGTGTWSATPTGFSRQWRRDGAAIAGATGATYAVVAADVYHQLSCLVSASNAAGTSAPSESEAVLVPGPESPPANVTRPVVSGTPTVGQLLTCDPGEWSGAPTSYYFGWRRDTELRPGTNATTYLVTADDVAHDVSCRVTASNGHGTSAAATSAARAVVAGGEVPILPPHNTVPPWITGVAETGRVLFCHPGEWTNGPTFTYVWKVSNSPNGVTTETYTVQPDDAGRSVRCSVTGTNPAGVSAVPSAEVFPVQSPAVACAGGPKVVIQKGAVWARSRRVRLQVLLPVGATAVQVSHHASFADAQRRVLVASCGYRWRLPGGVSKATVHVRFPGAADPAAAVTDSIRIDTHVPKVTRADAHWNNSRAAWVLTVRGTDRGSGLRTMEYAKAKGSGVLSTGYGKQVVTADKTQIQWIRLLDRAGNKSAWVRVLFTG